MAQSRLCAIQFCLFSALLGCVLPEHIAAQTQGAADEYKRVIESAVLEFDSGNWREARALFEQAHSLRPSARTLRGMGKASYELKDYVRAQRELVSSLTELRMPLSDPQREEITALLSRIVKFVGVLKVRVKPDAANASVMIDGTRMEGELKLNLGQHDLTVQADGYQSLNRVISIEGGKTQHLELTLNPVLPEINPALQPIAAVRAQEQSGLTFPKQEPKRSPSDQASAGILGRWWFWTIVGVAVAGGAAAAVVLTARTVPNAAVPGNTGLSIQVLTLGR